MDPVVIAALFTLIGTIVLATFSLRTGRGQLNEAASGNLRDDLLALSAQQDAKIAQQDAKIERQDAKIEALRVENASLQSRVWELQEWGRWATEPVPRTPPLWGRPPVT